jgi:hypothetical protein
MISVKHSWSVEFECSDVNQTRQLIPASALTIPQSMHLHFSLESYLAIYYLKIEIRSLDVNFMPLLHLPWDPGGLSRDRLDGKPKIKGGRIVSDHPTEPTLVRFPYFAIF